MSKRDQLYRKTFRALHGKNERLLTRGVIKAIKTDLSDLPPLQRDNYLSYLKGLEFKALEAELIKGWERSGQIGTFVYNEIEGQRQKRINPFFSEVWAALIFRNSRMWIGSKIVTIKGTLLEQIQDVITSALAESVALVNITDEINKTVNKRGFYRWQAMRIARTETTSAMNTAMEVAGKESNLLMEKRWLTAMDGRERESHAALNNNKVAMNENFANGLKYPGDPSGSAGEIINCRCTFSYVPMRDASGNLIMN